MENDFLSIKDCKLEEKKLYEIGEKKFVRYIWRK